MTLAKLPPVKSTKAAKNTKVVKPQKPAKSAAQMPRPFRWTSEQYHQLGTAGIFVNARVELIHGEIIEMSPIGSRHFAGTNLGSEALRNAFGNGYFVSVQNPIHLADGEEPEPDLAVIAGSARDFSDALPTTAVLVVEVSDTTLFYDRTTKADLYARAGIQELWILNLQNRYLEVYRNPVNGKYAPKTIYRTGQSVAPLAAPQSPISVDDLLP